MTVDQINKSPYEKRTQTLDREEEQPSDDNQYKAQTLEEYQKVFKEPREQSDTHSQILNWNYKADTLEEYKKLFVSPHFASQQQKKEDGDDDGQYAKQG